MSESLAHQNPRSPFRRAPSTLARSQLAQGGPAGLANATDTEELLKMAKDNIKNLKQRGRMVCDLSFIMCGCDTVLQRSSSHIDDSMPLGPLARQT